MLQHLIAGLALCYTGFGLHYLLAFERVNGLFKPLYHLVQALDLLLVVNHLVENVAHLCFVKFTAFLRRLVDL